MVGCAVNDVTPVAVTTSTSMRGEAYWYCPSFPRGNSVAHAFLSVLSRVVWVVLFIIVGLTCCLSLLFHRGPFSASFLFRTAFLANTPFSS